MIFLALVSALGLAQEVEWTSLTRSDVKDQIGTQLQWRAHLKPSASFEGDQSKEIAALAKKDGTLDATFDDDDGVVSLALMTQFLLKPFLESASRKNAKLKSIEAMFNSPAIQWTETEALFREQIERMILRNYLSTGWPLQKGKDLVEQVFDPTASFQEISQKINETFLPFTIGNIPVEILAKVIHRDPLTYSDIAAVGQALSVVLETHFYRVTYGSGSESREFAESSAAKERYAYSDFGQLFQIMNQFPMTAAATNLDRTSWPVYKFSIRLPEAEPAR